MGRVFGKDLTNSQDISKNIFDDFKKSSRSISFNHSKNTRPTTALAYRNHPTENYVIEEEEFDYNHDLADRMKSNDPQFVTSYAKEIFNFCKEAEDKFPPRYGYMAIRQKDINEKMRAILIDWLVDVHMKFNLRQETLYLTVNIIDRFLEKVEMTRSKLQLVGVAAMLISCKYEEIYSPEVKDFAYITDNAFTRSEVLQMEGKILSVLEFNLLHHSILLFQERLGHLANCTEKPLMLSKYICELSLIEYTMMKYKPVMIASAALYLSLKLFKIPNPWADSLSRATGFTESDVRSCAKELCVLLYDSGDSHLQAIKRKYSSPKYLSISKVQLERK